jgi:hypothetical protein
MSLALDENLRRALAGARRALEERIALAQSMRIQAIEKGQMSRSHSLRHVDELAAAFATGNVWNGKLPACGRCLAVPPDTRGGIARKLAKEI